MQSAAHDVEAAGPVSTADALRRVRRGAGTGRARPQQPGVGTLVTRDPHRAPLTPVARLAAAAMAASWCSIATPRPDPPWPRLAAARAQARRSRSGRRRRGTGRHPRRQAIPAARGGARARRLMLAAVTGEHVKDAAVHESAIHPVPPRVRGPDRGRFAADASAHGDRNLNIVAFGGISGRLLLHALRRDCRKASPFGKRIAHGSFRCVVRRSRACSCRRPKARCWPTTASTRSAS